MGWAHACNEIINQFLCYDGFIEWIIDAYGILITMLRRCGAIKHVTKSGDKMKIKDVMSTDIAAVMVDTGLRDVAKKMYDHDCGCVMVVDNDRLVGMITDRDIAIRCVANAHDPESIKARDIMSRDILHCLDTDGADDVTRKMGDEKIRRMPVLNAENRLVGIVTLGDLASHSNHELCGQTLGKICRAPQSENDYSFRSFAAL